MQRCSTETAIDKEGTVGKMCGSEVGLLEGDGLKLRRTSTHHEDSERMQSQGSTLHSEDAKQARHCSTWKNLLYCSSTFLCLVKLSLEFSGHAAGCTQGLHAKQPSPLQ